MALAFSRSAIGAGLALFMLAMLLYPGGTALDPSTRGYSFFQNFGSDLGRTVAFNGQPNRASQIVARLAGIVLMLGLVAGTSGVAGTYSTSRVSRACARAAMVVGLVAGSSVVIGFLIPADLGPTLHRQLAAWGFDLAPIVPLFFAIATARDSRFPAGAVAGWIFLTVVLAGFLATPLLGTSDADHIIRVTAQKVVFVTISGTLLYESYEARRAISG